MSPKSKDRTLLERLRRFAAHAPIKAFLILTFTLSWSFAWLAPLSSHGILPLGNIEHMAVGAMVASMLVSVLLITAAEGGRTAVKELLGRAFQFRFGARWYAIVLLGLPVLSLVMAMMLGGSFRDVRLTELMLSQAWILLYTLLIVNLWEELVWAGFFQKRLEGRFGLYRAALITALPFAGVHVPMAFAEIGISTIVTIVVLLVYAPVFRILVGLVQRGAGGSVLAVGLLHAMHNRVLNADGLNAMLVEGADFFVTGALAVLILTAGIAWFSRGRKAKASATAPALG